MKPLPKDIIRCISEYLNLNELCSIEQADRDFHLPKQKRKKSFTWSSRRINKRQRYKDGKCMVNSCIKQRSVCIQFEPLQTIVLSHYCTIHTRQYSNEPLENI